MGRLADRIERAMLGEHLSRVNTQISSSLTKVMVQGVSLNNPATDACDFKSSTLKGTTKEGKHSGHHLSCSVQYFNTFNTTVKRIIKQQGHGACLSFTALYPVFLSREMEKYAWKPQVRDLNYQTNLLLKKKTDWSPRTFCILQLLLKCPRVNSIIIIHNYCFMLFQNCATNNCI